MDASTWAVVVTVAGLLVDVVGAWVVASSVIITNEQAIDESVMRLSSDEPEQT